MNEEVGREGGGRCLVNQSSPTVLRCRPSQDSALSAEDPGLDRLGNG